jgi:hypothetical protein
MTDRILEQTLQIHEAQDLHLLTDFLHDEFADIDSMAFDSEHRSLLILVSRQYHGGEEIVVEEKANSRIYEKSWMHSQLMIKQVNSWDTKDDQGIGFYTFNHFEYTNGLLIIEFNQMLVLNIYVSELDIELEDMGFKGRTRIERWAGGESSSGMEY